MKIEYNTFGKGSPFDELTDFLNTLREPENLHDKIQTDVMHLMHDINKESFHLYFIILRRGISTQKNMLQFDTYFFNKMTGLLYNDFIKRIQDRPWRHALKCKVIACLNKRFEKCFSVKKK